ncbi:MAG: helix-turn-helix domain-containing protein [Bacteroidetes bacterium]|nr:MAG: helix-turn-helix domain-containing protein [Bacteroidota bacterium]
MTKLIPSFNFTKQLKESLGFSLTNLEESYSGYNAALPHRHKYYEILFFNHSGGVHEIDFNTYPIKAKSIHFVSPEQVHLLQRDKRVTGYVLSFTNDFLLESDSGILFLDQLGFFNNPYSSPVSQLKEKQDIKDCEFLINKIQTEYFSKNPDKKPALQSWLKLFLIHCKRLHKEPGQKEGYVKTKSDITLNFKKLLEIHFRNVKSVSEYAGKLSITAGHLSETIQKDTGKTAGEFIHDRIILEAKRLLYHSKKSIKEIAAELNYEDPSYFSKFFKTHSGSSPEQFRKDIREKYH